MPFILNQYRGCLDWYIQDAEKNKIWECLSGLQTTLDDKNKIPENIFLGALNYSICQLYRKTDIMNAESITLMLLIKYFLDEPRYIKLLQATGTLYSVRYAFREHLFETCGINTEEKIVSSLDKLIDYTKNAYITYETMVKETNGDLE